MTYRLGLGVSMEILRDPRVLLANNRQPNITIDTTRQRHHFVASILC
jgi:hypothetical protein